MQSSFTEKKGGVWVRFFEPNIRDGIAMLQQKAQQAYRKNKTSASFKF